MCFQRDSRKDQVIVWGFILGTAGLLGWAGVRRVLEMREAGGLPSVGIPGLGAGGSGHRWLFPGSSSGLVGIGGRSSRATLNLHLRQPDVYLIIPSCRYLDVQLLRPRRSGPSFMRHDHKLNVAKLFTVRWV